ncbi:hypothetical protein R5R35_002684 [Gryllus longicercus]|uniref:MADF domain-containing protein n=2 Tax=Gryllus longicercus TaxID=2509291 RepID=A0AAN9VWC6_9ORTH
MFPRYRWSDGAVMRFVNLYKNEPVLWDATHENYKSKAARVDALKRIASVMNMKDFGINECRYKIKNLRTHYCQELAKIRNTTATATSPSQIYKPTLVWFSTMDEFLRPFVIMSSNADPSVRKQNVIKTDIQEGVHYVEFSDSQWGSMEGQDITEQDMEGHPMNEGMENEIVNQEGEANSYDKNEEEHSFTQKLENNSFNQESGHSSHRMTERKRKSINAPIYVGQRMHDPDQFLDSRIDIPETEFDLWARSLAIQLNSMEVTRALELQLKIQTLVSQERLAYERKKVKVHYTPSVPEFPNMNQCSSLHQT